MRTRIMEPTINIIVMFCVSMREGQEYVMGGEKRKGRGEKKREREGVEEKLQEHAIE